MKVSLAVLATGGALLFSVCRSTPSQLSPGEARLQGRSVALRLEPSTHMALAARADSVQAALPENHALSRSPEQNSITLQAEDRVTDPASVIGPALQATLITNLGMREAQEGAADVVLSVKVTGWGALYLLPLMTRYGGTVQAQAKLVDAATQKTLRRTTCFVRPHRQPDSPTLDELLQDGGERLRAVIDAATQECLTVLSAGMLGK